jgi:esterase/lipase superfamily enzyme
VPAEQELETARGLETVQAERLIGRAEALWEEWLAADAALQGLKAVPADQAAIYKAEALAARLFVEWSKSSEPDFAGLMELQTSESGTAQSNGSKDMTLRAYELILGVPLLGKFGSPPPVIYTPGITVWSKAAPLNGSESMKFRRYNNPLGKPLASSSGSLPPGLRIPSTTALKPIDAWMAGAGPPGTAALFEATASNSSFFGGVVRSEPYSVVVFFATDRALDARTRQFGPLRARSTTRGAVQVSIPADHKLGNIERPGWFRLLIGSEPNERDDMVAKLPRAMSIPDFYEAIKRASVMGDAARSAFIFVHGYNNSFEEAALRTAQMAVDLQLPTVPVFYSWPSHSKEVDYFGDSSNALWAEKRFAAFLDEFAQRSDAPSIYLIAHSMGARIASQGLAELLEKRPQLAGRFKEILLAAPDIDAGVFKEQIGPRLVEKNAKVTLYASSNDKSLQLSKKANGFPRAGDSGAGLSLVPGIETVDASAIETDWLSHSYYANTRPLLTDITLLLRYQIRAAGRPTLRKMTGSEGLTYWYFVP